MVCHVALMPLLVWYAMLLFMCGMCMQMLLSSSSLLLSRWEGRDKKGLAWLFDHSNQLPFACMQELNMQTKHLRGTLRKTIYIFCDISMAKYIHGKGGKVGKERVWRDTEKYKLKPDEITS